MRITPDVNVVVGDDFQAANAGTVGSAATSVLSASANTKSVILQCASTNTEAVYFGDSGLTNPSVTEDGIPVAAGGAIVLDTSADIFGISQTGSQKVYVAYIATT